MSAALRPYAFTVQTNTGRCLVCDAPEDRDNPFVAVCTPRRGNMHWMHRGACHEAHSAKCAAERDAARAAQRMGAAA